MIRAAAFACAVAVALVPAATQAGAEQNSELVAGTSLVAELIGQLDVPARAIRTLLPPDMCPGHYDVRPGDIEALAACRLLVLQPWQRDMPNVKAAIKASGIPEERIRLVNTPGNWMLPPTRAAASRALGTLLAAEYPERHAAIALAAEQAAAQSLAAGEWAQSELKKAAPSALTVLCSEQQADFVRWTGMNVAGSFGRAEAMSVAQTEELVQRAKASGVALVVDNLQSGDSELGKALAKTIGAEHVVLSNFPGSEPQTGTWEQMLQSNVRKLIAAAAKWRAAHA